MKNSITIFFTLFLFSCLEEVEIPKEGFEQILVIEGYVDTQSDVHTIKLSSTSDLSGVGEKALVQNATVRIESLTGDTYLLNEMENGIYQTNPAELVASEGESYRLLVSLEDGSSYESLFERIEQPVVIQNGYGQLVEKTLINENLVESKAFFHDLYLEIENSYASHFFKVDNSGWAEVRIFYELPPILNPPPPPGPTTCWQLRDPINDQNVYLGTNQKIAGESYIINPLNVPVDQKGRYVAILEVKSMSAASFQYWKKVKDQLDQEGGIFDPPFAPIPGNIQNINGTNRVLGYFHAYSSTTMEVCFDRTEVPVIYNVPVITDLILCTDVWSPATFTNQAEAFCQ